MKNCASLFVERAIELGTLHAEHRFGCGLVGREQIPPDNAHGE